MFRTTMTIEGFDPELAKAILGEQRRQEDHVELIASENYTSPRVLEAQGSVLTNKYAEGYPGKRYTAAASSSTSPSSSPSTGRNSSSTRRTRTSSRTPGRRRMRPPTSRSFSPGTPFSA